MKKSFTFRLLTAPTVCALLGVASWMGILSSALGQVAPVRSQLENFDKRSLATAPAAVASPEKQAAVTALQARVAGAKVEFDPVVGTPKFVYSGSGFLSGPNGQGKGISEAAAGALPANDPHRAVKAFLNDHSALFGHGAEILANANVKRDYVTPHNGLHTVIWEQQVDGIPVFEQRLIANTTKNGELVSVASQFVPNVDQAIDAGVPNRAAFLNQPPISAEQAVANAAVFVGEDQQVGEVITVGAAPEGPARHQQFKASKLKGETDVKLVWLPMSRAVARPCWEIILVSRTRGEMFRVLVDAQSGDSLVRQSLTHYISDATYRVFTSDSPSPFSPSHPTPLTNQPPLVSRVLVVTNAISIIGSPNGWINDGNNTTVGNNVNAHTDVNDDNVADPNSSPTGSPSRVFDFALDLNSAPSTYTNAAVVQLFYWCNFYHDKLYDLGFTEAAGNFQTSNFGRGGLGNDAVEADAQDGANLNDVFHRNNANFSTPPDGIPGRMQMYVFDGPTPDRDGDLDAEIVLHEHTHGLSNRLVGGGVGISALQPGGMGEGWSDFYGLSLLSEPTDALNGNYAVGGYATFALTPTLTENYYYGIRRYPYSTDMTKNPLTFKDIDPQQASSHPGVPRSPANIFGPADEVHNQGEVWCVTLWDVRANLIAKHGFTNGNQLVLQLVTDGMKLSPANPTFLQARDAIVLADRVNNGGANYTNLWAAFAKRGMGASAMSPGSSTTIGVVEAYDLPALTLSSVTFSDASFGNGNGVIDFNETIELNVSLVNAGAALATGISATLSTTTPGVSFPLPNGGYPDLPVFAVATNFIPYRMYTSPSFVAGTPIDVRMVVATDQRLYTNTFRLNTGGPGAVFRFDNNTPLPIPDNVPAGVDSFINISGFSSLINKVTVSLYLTHTFDADLTIQLIGPDGTTVNLSMNNGGSGDNYGTAAFPDSSRTTFDDAALTPISSGTPPFVGTFRPDQALSAYLGKSGAAVNGTWRLHVADIFRIDTGTLQNWSLSLTATASSDGGGPTPATTDTDVAVAQSVVPEPFFVGLNTIYTLVVTNKGPGVATGVTLTNWLPQTVNLVSATTTRGSCVVTGGVVTCSLGTMPNRSSTTVTLVVVPTNSTPLTNMVAVALNELDINPSNNRSTRVSTQNTQPGLYVADVAILEGNIGSVSASFNVILSPPTTQSVTVAYSTANGTALAGSDYVATSGVLTFAPGVTNQTVTVTVLSDTVYELDETYFLNLVNPTNAVIAKSAGVGTILNDDPLPNLSVNNVSVVEGNSGTTNAVFAVTLSPASGLPTLVNYATAIGTAAAGRDYQSTSGTLVFAPGVTTRTITVKVIGDTIPEADETFMVNLTDPVNALILVNQGVGTIINDDPLPVLTISDVAVVEGNSGTTNAIFNLTLSTPSGLVVFVDFATADGTATLANSDYQTNSGSLTFPPGVTNRTVSVLVNGDTVDEQNETFFVNLSNISGATLARTQATGIIINDDGPVLSINDVAVIEGNVGTTDAILTVTLVNPNANTVTVDFNSLNGTATLANNDYQTNSGSLTFPPGITSRTITNKVVGDLTPESTETFSVVLSNPSFATISRDTGIVTITDDDTLADLALLLTDSVAPIFVGGDLTYTLTVTNRGPYGATNVVVIDTLPTNVNFVSATISQGNYSNAAGVVTCNLGVLTNGASGKITILVSPAAVGLITNSAGVTAIEPDPNTGNNSASVLTTVVTPLITVVTAGAVVTSESVQPPNGAIDPNETVTLAFALRNTGNKNTTNLTATLQASGGVSLPSAAQNYGTLVYGGPAVSLPFTFTANGTAGSVLTAVLRLMDGGLDLGSVTNTFRIGSRGIFIDTAANKIPDAGTSGPASQYPALLNVSGLTGLVSKVTLTLSNLTHAFAADLDILLVSPSGEVVAVMSDAGGVAGVTNVTLTLDDAAATPLPDTSAIVSGTFKPTDYNIGGPDNFPAPAPAAPYGTTLSVFNGINPNGTWSLFIVDDAAGDVGILAGGWSLQINTVTTINSTAGLSVVITNSSDTLYVGRGLTNTITVQNQGPDTATGVVVTDALPGGVTFVSANASQGTCAITNGVITCALGSLASNATATVTVIITNVPQGTITSTAAVALNETDLNLANNIATATATVKPFADLAVSQTASPNPVTLGSNLTYTVTVTNRGPSLATGVVVTNTLPTGAIFISAKSAQGTCAQASGVVTCQLGAMTNGATVVVTIVVLPTAPGTATGIAVVSGVEDDLKPVNNTASFLATVNPAADLAVTQFASADPVTIGNRLTYTLTVTNAGPSAATGVTLTNTLPAGANVGPVTNPYGSSQAAGGVVTCNLGTLASGASATITVAVTNTLVGLATNLATVAANELDTNLANNSAAVSITVNDISALIAPAGTSVLAESFSPPNGAVDPGETVTLNLALRNKGAVNTASLTATLLATGGVTAPSGPQNYGVVVAGGATVARSFSFTASGTNGGVVTATLRLRDGATDLGTVSYTFYLGAVASFTNTAAIAIPATGTVGNAGPYPSTITVSNLNGTVSKVTATLNGLSHTYPHDIDILLVGPFGQKMILMADTGGGSAVNNLTLIFDDAATNSLPNSTLITAGTYKPSSYSSSVTPPVFTNAPAGNAPAGPYGSALSVFNGTNPNGTWSLYVVDDSSGDLGSLANGWSLTITTVTTINPSVDLALTIVDAPDPVVLGNSVTYTITVTNKGPNTATNIVLTDPLPVSLDFISASVSQGSYSNITGTLTCTLGSLVPGATATVTIIGKPNVPGTITNVVSVVADQVELVPADNTVTALTTVQAMLATQSSQVLTNGNFGLMLNALSQQTYVIQASTNLIDWISIRTNVVTGPTNFLDIGAANYTFRFYRVIQK